VKDLSALLPPAEGLLPVLKDSSERKNLTRLIEFIQWQQAADSTFRFPSRRKVKHAYAEGAELQQLLAEWLDNLSRQLPRRLWPVFRSALLLSSRDLAAHTDSPVRDLSAVVKEELDREDLLQISDMLALMDQAGISRHHSRMILTDTLRLSAHPAMPGHLRDFRPDSFLQSLSQLQAVRARGIRLHLESSRYIFISLGRKSEMLEIYRRFLIRNTVADAGQ